MSTRLLLLLLAVVVIGAAVGGAVAVLGSSPEDAAAPPAASAGSGAPTPAPTAAPTEAPTVDPASVGANELGQVPVLMYHRLLADGGGDYDNTPEEFRAELQRLYDEGYRPVTVRDLVRGEIDIPAGTSPVVLTFDDSTTEQFALDEAGEVRADTAIGILLEFAAAHEGFDPVATLFVNEQPFAQSDGAQVLQALHERGFEIGNHSQSHVNLGTLDAEGVQRELAHGAALITDAVPEAEVTSLALPLGVWPEPHELAVSGAADGLAYAHEAILLVGAEPAPSPFATDFDPLALPRIRSAAWDGGEPNYGSTFWLDWFADNPERRYVSDGNPDTIAYPSGTDATVAPAHADRALAY